MTELSLPDLVGEYTSAQAWTLDLIEGLAPDEVIWRPDDNSSSIGWHLGHQGAVNHYLVRNLTSAEVTFDATFDRVFDSATPEPERGDMPSLDEILGYRDAITRSTMSVVGRIGAGDVGAPAQLALVAKGLMLAVINHEYQHSQWINEVRSTMTDQPTPIPNSRRLTEVDGYWTIQLT